MSAHCKLLWQEREKQRKSVTIPVAKRDMGILSGKLRFLRRKDGKNKPHVLQRGVFCSLPFRYAA